MTREEAKDSLSSIIGTWKKMEKSGDSKWARVPIDDLDIVALEVAINALQTENCEDAISRQAVDDYISHWMSGYIYDEERTRLEEFSAWLWDDLPSVKPQKVGRSEMYKILQSIRAECWDAGWNMTGEYQGAWTRYRDIEKIIDKYMQKLEEGDAE